MTWVPTPEQEQIITATPPLRIAAGAGTGKTATITRVVVDRVVTNRVAADQVLGITFTNKAAAELAGRIQTEIGAASPVGIEADIHTYHGFAHRILAEFGPLIGIERNLSIITPTYARQLLLEAIGRESSYVHLKLHNRRNLIPDLARLASMLGDNLLTSDALLALPVSSDLDHERQEMATVISHFEAEKDRLGVLDYSDLLRLAHQLLETQPEVVNELRQRYALVVLDEYQDTSPAQRMFLQTAFSDGFEVIAVGDADQTIYEWRGATIQNFADFPSHFPKSDGSDAETLHLSLNRRSGSLILDVANALRAEIDAAERKVLGPLPEAGPGRVTTSWYRSARQEADGIADLLYEAHESGVRWRDMAVLFRKNADISMVRHALEAADIPAEVASVGGLLEIPEVVEVHAWLRVLNDPTDSVALARILMGSRYRLGLADLRPLSDWVRSHADDTDGPVVGHIEALDRLDELEAPERVRAALSDFRALFRNLLEHAQGVSLVELVRRVLDAIAAWREIEALPGTRALSTRLNMYRFLDLAEAWSPLEGRPSLPAFLDHLDLMAEDSPEELDTARISSEDAVTLLTVHRAKGLEWDVVCVPNLTHNTFPSSMRRTEDPFKFAVELPFDLRLDAGSLPHLTATMSEDERRDLMRGRHEAQEWRLAYVAATRAKYALHLSGAYWYGSPEPNKKPKAPSMVLAIAKGIAGVEDRAIATEPGDRPTTLRPQTSASGPDPLFGDAGWVSVATAALTDNTVPGRLAADAGISEAYDQAVEEFQDMLFALPEAPGAKLEAAPPSTSVTGLVTYAGCPKQFFWSEVDRLPRRPSSAARRGIDVHRRIELHNLGSIPIDDFEEVEYDVPAVDGGGTAPFEAFLKSPYAERTPILIETPFELRLEAGSIRGRVDAVYGDEDQWEIVDFKSGRPSEDPALDTQLEAYALAATAGALTVARPSALSVSFVFLGEGFKARTETVDEEWTTHARAHITELLAGIAAERFDPTPSARCARCDFVRFCPEGTAWSGSS